MSNETNAALPPFEAGLLPQGVRSRFVDDVNGLRMHVLEAGFGDSARPSVVLLHGFPELAFSWRKVMPALADAGFHVIAPDQRGYGRTSGWRSEYDTDLSPFRLLDPGARRAGAGVPARPAQRGGSCRTRFRLPGRGVVLRSPGRTCFAAWRC